MKKCLLFVALLAIFSCSSDSVSDPATDPDQLNSCFTVPDNIVAGNSIILDSGCSQNAASFAWYLGEEMISSSQNPSHTFAASGTYTITLVVEDAEGNSHEMAKTLEVAASGENSEIIHYGEITADETWEAGITHKIFGHVTVMDATLTIEAGVIVCFMENAKLNVGTEVGVSTATLIAEGTASNKILFTACSDTPVNGYWNNINFGKGDSGNSRINHAIIEYGGGNGSYTAMVQSYDASLSIDNTHFRNSGADGMSVDEVGFKSFANNIFTDCDGFVMAMNPNSVHTLGLGNQFTTDKGIHVANAVFNNAESTWAKQSCPYIVLGDLRIYNTTGTKLIIAPGTRLGFGEGASLKVGGIAGNTGTLIAEGTAQEPIEFFSYIDSYLRNGRWYGIHFLEGTDSSTSLKYCTVEKTAGFNTAKMAGITVNDAAVNINNVTITDALVQGIYCNEEGRFASFENNTISQVGQSGISLFANWAHTVGDTNTITAEWELLVNTDYVNQDVTWKKLPFPYSIYGRIWIGSETGNMLTIAPGATISFVQGVYMMIDSYATGGGGLVADGTPELPITFTTGNPSPAPGQWQRIQLMSNTLPGTILDNCIFEYGGSYEAAVELVFTDAPVITNNIFRNNEYYGLRLQSSNPTLSGNIYENNGTGDVLVLQ